MIKKKSIAVSLISLALTASLVGCTPKTNQSSSDPEYQSAVKLVSEGKFEDAIKQCTEKINNQETNYQWYGLRGCAEVGLANYEEAYKDLKIAIEKNPEVAWYYRDYSMACVKTGRLDEAIEAASQAIELSDNVKDKVLAYQTRGAAYNQKLDYQKAIRDNSRAIRIGPDEYFPYAHRASIYLTLGDYQKALADVDKAISINDKIAYGYYIRGDIYHYKGDYKKALLDIDKAISLEPKYYVAYELKAEIYDMLHEDKKAIEAADKLIELLPDKSSAYCSRAFIYIGLEKIELAEADLKKCQELEPESNYTKALSAALYCIKGDGKKALAELDSLGPMHSSSERVIYYKAIAHLTEKNYDKVIEICKEVIKRTPKQGYAYRVLSEAYKRKGNQSEAKKIYDQALAVGYIKEGFTERLLNQIN